MAARRKIVGKLQDQGPSRRRALRLVGMSTSTLRYRPRDDGNGQLRERLNEPIPALYVTRLLDQAKAERGLPKVIPHRLAAPSLQAEQCRSGLPGTASS